MLPTSSRFPGWRVDLGGVLLGRGPGEMDMVVFGVPSALRSLRFLAHCRKAGSNWAGPRVIGSTVV